MGVEYRKLQKLGNSLVVSLPSDFVEKYGLKKGQYVTIWEEDGKLIIEVPRK